MIRLFYFISIPITLCSLFIAISNLFSEYGGNDSFTVFVVMLLITFFLGIADKKNNKILNIVVISIIWLSGIFFSYLFIMLSGWTDDEGMASILASIFLIVLFIITKMDEQLNKLLRKETFD